MKTRAALIRLHRFQVDELRRKLTSLEEIRADLLAKDRQLVEDLEAERVRSQDSDIGRFAYPSYAQSVKQRRENLSASVREVEQEIDAAKEELNGAYRELKKIEVAEENRERLADTMRKRAEQAAFDETAVIQHARKS